MKTISGHIVDLISRRIFDGSVTFDENRIRSIVPQERVEDQFIMPGFVDAHIHIESSMMVPSEFARHVLPHGTIACVCDPHEIANVCGIQGIDYMIEDGNNSPLNFCFGAPSCVPATHAETSGAVLKAEDIKTLLQRDDIGFLAEMMNFPGVINRDEQVLLKLKAARDLGKPIDGHAPELSGDGLRSYVDEGISTDHECMTLAEAKEKIALGMKILIREGSAARNLDDLMPLLGQFPDKVMLCSDDKHPDDLFKNGHIDHLIRRILLQGYDLFDTLRACSLNPSNHYGLNTGFLQTGDKASFVVVNNLKEFRIKETWINGELVAKEGKAIYSKSEKREPINQFNALPIEVEALKVNVTSNRMRVLSVEDGQLYTKSEYATPLTSTGNAISDVSRDLLKLVVYNRYQPSSPSIAFVRNFGLKKGAMASTVAHDSHNIVAVGVSDNEIAEAINKLIANKGGIVAFDGEITQLLALPVGGLMSDERGEQVAQKYELADRMAKSMGTKLNAPFMTLAFLSLLVIPELKLSDKGLFDVKRFTFTDLFVNEH
jgi:adenine deaminase